MELFLGASICHLSPGWDTCFSGATAGPEKEKTKKKSHGGWTWSGEIGRKTQVSLQLECFLAMWASGRGMSFQVRLNHSSNCKDISGLRMLDKPPDLPLHCSSH